MIKIRKVLGVFLCLMMVATVFSIVALSGNVIAEESQFPEEKNGWWTEGYGTYFEIAHSEYLQITMSSSENIYAYLESIPNVISYHIETDCTSMSTFISLNGFEVGKTYYRYQDGFLQEEFITDETGSYSYIQDISIPHHVYVQETTSTLYISSDYTFTEDIYDSIVVTADNIVIDGNDFTLNGPGPGYGIYGIYLNGRSGITIKNVNVNNFAYGIYLYSSHNNTVIDNPALNNREGIRLFWNSDTNTISGNTVSSNTDYGISLIYSTNNVINSNTVSGSYFGISLGNYVTHNTINGNMISGCTWAIYLGGTNTNTICGNTIYGNGWGIWVYNANSLTISGNTISNNGWGIHVYYHANSNTISGNTISVNSNYGIYLNQYSDDNTISGNTVSGNGWGFYVFYFSNNNYIFHNNIIGNTIQLHNSLSMNTWDNGAGEGNYWSDYTGFDDGSIDPRTGLPRVAGDGIGDTDLPHQEVDWYPLKQPWNPDPLDAIEKLRQYIIRIENINNGIKNSLISQLNAAENALSNDHEDTAKNILNAFINHIEALIESGKLTQEQGDYMISSTHHIIDLIMG